MAFVIHPIRTQVMFIFSPNWFFQFRKIWKQMKKKMFIFIIYFFNLRKWKYNLFSDLFLCFSLLIFCYFFFFAKTLKHGVKGQGQRIHTESWISPTRIFRTIAICCYWKPYYNSEASLKLFKKKKKMLSEMTCCWWLVVANFYVPCWSAILE